MKHHYVNRVLSYQFTKIGYLLGKYPICFVVGCILTTAALSCGLFFITVTKDVDGIYSPSNGRTRIDRAVIEPLFPPDKSVEPMKRMRFGRMGILIFEKNHGDNILKRNAMKEIVDVNNAILKISVIWKNRTLTYVDLCSKTVHGECFVNEILSFYDGIDNIERKRTRFRFPVHREDLWHRVLAFPNWLGGVKTDEEGYIDTAKAVRLFYILNYTTPEKDEICDKWEDAFLDAVSKMKPNETNIYRFVGSSVDKEFNRITETAMPLMVSAGFIMVAFAVMTCMTTDWVSSKPWIGIAGCLSPLLGVISAFGMLLLCGMEYVDINVSVPFLLVGIGLDDSFVLLAAWRRTDPTESVQNRMSKTYAGAAVSVTITSLTNFLSFGVAITTHFKVIQVYSAYASLSILFTYMYQIFFFGGLLAISGIREQRNIHPLFFFTVKPQYISKPFMLRLLYVGWINDKPANPKKERLVVTFYRDKLATALSWKCSKVLILTAFILYISGAIYSLRFLKEGLDFRSAVPYSSYSIDFLTKINEDFSQYPHGVQIVINQTLDYSNPQVQDDIKEIMSNFSGAPNMAGSKLTECWLSYYLSTVRNENLWFLFQGYNMSIPKDFMEGLQVFLKLPYPSKFKNDIIFSEDKKKIVASRFLVFSNNINNIRKEKNLLIDLWKVQDSSKYPVYIHNIWFVSYNQHVVIMETTLQSLGITIGLLMVTLLLFLPNLFCAICVALSVISTQVGVMGYMSLLDVRLDTISMVCLIMCAGLSVDYSAHICYAYITFPSEDPNEKIKEALCASGHPVVQGCLSTILGVVILGFGASDIFSIFTKVISMVMLFSCFHSLFLLPTCLSLLDTCFQFVSTKNRFSKQDKVVIQSEVNNLMIEFPLETVK